MLSAAASTWLLLIDCRREVALTGSPTAAPQADRAVGNIKRLLAHARGVGWQVLHAWRSPTGPELRGPIVGLEPLSTEPVFRCNANSVLSLRALRNVVEHDCPAEIYVAGFGLGDMCIATIIGAEELGVAATLIEDAAAASPVGGCSAAEIERVVVALVARFARVATTDEITAEGSGKVVRLRARTDGWGNQ